MQKIIIFGAGKVAEVILSFSLKPNYSISFICDNDKAKWGASIAGYEIKKPENLVTAEFDYIICAVRLSIRREIYNQLLDYGIPDTKIVYTFDYAKLNYCNSPLDVFFDIKKTIVPFIKNKVMKYGNDGGETSKAHGRRGKEAFFEKYCKGDGLDIGCGNDPVVPGCSGWNLINGDAQYLKGIDDETFDWVYSSHCLEHMWDVRCAISNWFRVVKLGGYLILYIPQRDLYEKKEVLPSLFNGDHKHMFLLGKKSAPDTLDIIEEIREALDAKDYVIEYIKTCKDGYVRNAEGIQSFGEYSIECVIKKTPF